MNLAFIVGSGRRQYAEVFLPQPYLDERDPSGRSYACLAMIAWKVLTDSYERSSQGLASERYLPPRYEDFQRTSLGTLQQIVSILGLPWTVAFERHVRRQKIDGSRSRAFEHDLSPDPLAALRSSPAENLLRYGYAVEGARGGHAKPADRPGALRETS